jgi:BMFP domain-containing protein YqiC
MQTENPFFDGLARLLTDAAGAAQGARAEFETFVKQKLEKLVADMDLVRRDEFDAVKAMAAKARSENERLTKKLAALERRGIPRKKRILPRSKQNRKL